MYLDRHLKPLSIVLFIWHHFPGQYSLLWVDLSWHRRTSDNAIHEILFITEGSRFLGLCLWYDLTNCQAWVSCSWWCKCSNTTPLCLFSFAKSLAEAWLNYLATIHVQDKYSFLAWSRRVHKYLFFGMRPSSKKYMHTIWLIGTWYLLHQTHLYVENSVTFNMGLHHTGKSKDCLRCHRNPRRPSY